MHLLNMSHQLLVQHQQLELLHHPLALTAFAQLIIVQTKSIRLEGHKVKAIVPRRQIGQLDEITIAKVHIEHHHPVVEQFEHLCSVHETIREARQHQLHDAWHRIHRLVKCRVLGCVHPQVDLLHLGRVLRELGVEHLRTDDVGGDNFDVPSAVRLRHFVEFGNRLVERRNVCLKKKRL